MKIVFFSNYLNHHQLPFCLALYKYLNQNFVFVATERVSEKRIALGYADLDHMYPFVLTTYDNSQNEMIAEELAQSCDVMIYGDAPDKYLFIRQDKKKLTFRYSERFFKKGYYNWFIHYVYNRKHRRQAKNANTFLLCASTYAAGDYSLVRLYHNRYLQWGYFPEYIKYDIKELLDKKRRQDKIVLLWVGRLLDWKQPEMALKLAKYLKDKNIEYEMRIIGNGPLKEKMQNYISKNTLDDTVFMLGSMPPEKVRTHMEEATIFLFTSSYQEGWGAVLNESMNSGCVAVASHAAGASGFLIKHNKNGILFPCGKQKKLNRIVQKLIQAPKECEQIGKQAYETISDMWNAEIAADRLIKMSDDYKENGTLIPFREGPGSIARTIYNYNSYRILSNTRGANE